MRGGLALLLTMGGYVAVTRSFAEVALEGQPAVAHRLAPGNARARARLAFNTMVTARDAEHRQGAVRMARSALQGDPTAVLAVATLGLDADARGDTRAARRLFAYSQALTRRDLSTQIWAIEDAVGRRDVAGALHHYDVALRTSRAAGPLLFPVLTLAIADAPVRAELARVFKGKPSWRSGLIAHAIANSPVPDALVDLFAEMRRNGVPVAPEEASSLVNRLVLVGKADAAWQLYASIRPGADRRHSRDPRFTADIAQPAPFDWIAANASDVSASLQRGADGAGALAFSVPPNGGGTLAEQLQMLLPGRYRLVGRSRDIDQPERALPYWLVKCRDGRELTRVTVPSSAAAGDRFTGIFSVPADCPVQSIALVGRSSETIGGVTGEILSLSVSPDG